jgi:hypothetical protein
MTSQTDTAEARSRGRDLRDLVQMIRRYWIGEAAIVLLTIAVVALVTAVQPRVYEATATGLTQAATGESLSMAFAGDSLAKSRAESYVRVATSDAVAQRAQKALGTDQSTGSLLGSISRRHPMCRPPSSSLFWPASHSRSSTRSCGRISTVGYAPSNRSNGCSMHL